MFWLLLTLLALVPTTSTHAGPPTPPTLTPEREMMLRFCARAPAGCPPGTKPPSRAESQALAAKEAAKRRAHSTCEDLLPEVRALWDKNEAGHMLTEPEQMVWGVWKAGCEKRPYTSLGPRP